MKKLILIIIVSFLVFINVRMWGIEQKNVVMQNKAFGEKRRMERFKSIAAHKAIIKKYKNRANEAKELNILDYNQLCALQDRALNIFIDSSVCNELTLQQLLNLIKSEIELVEVLIYPMIGSKYARLEMRNKLLHEVIPSIKFLYQKILNAATHNEYLSAQYAQQGQGKKLVLNFDQKKIFLHTMYQRLSDVKDRIKKIQYTCALNDEKCLFL